MLLDRSLARKHDTRPPYGRPSVMRSLPDFQIEGPRNPFYGARFSAIVKGESKE